MSRGLYTDPYLAALLEKEPKLAKEFLEAISNSDYVAESEIVSCIEVPGWVLEKTGVRGFMNPNFPSKVFEKFLDDEESVAKNFWSTFEYANLSQKQVNKLTKHKDDNVRALALAHPLGDLKELLNHLKMVVSNTSHSSYVLVYIAQNVQLKESVFDFLFSISEYEGVSKTIGQALYLNPTLSDEQKAALVLSGIKPKDDSASDYWGEDVHFVSSIPYFDSLRVELGYYKGQKFSSIPNLQESLAEFFTAEGHHLSTVLPKKNVKNIQPSLRGLQELISLELFHRLFWTELCERDDFEIYRRNAYRVDDLFISHPILGREFEEKGAVSEESATNLGGVIMYGNQKWLSGNEVLDVDRASALLSSYSDSMLTIFEDANYDHFAQSLIAVNYENPQIGEKYGFEVTESGYEWMVDAATEIAEGDDFDVSAEINPFFGETLSWVKLPDPKKETIFEFLCLGFHYKISKLRSDSIHFLGCMALHQSTPKSILVKLAGLNDPLINEVLANRA